MPLPPLDGAFLFGHGRIVANSDVTPGFGISPGSAVIRAQSAACIRPQVSLFGEEADAGPRARALATV